MVKQFVLGAGLLALSVGAAASQIYSTQFTTLNNSGVTGSATLAYDSTANTLDVNIQAAGLEAGLPHAQHIHGLLGGDSMTPTLANSDANGDGAISFTEAKPQYGPVLIALTSPPGQGKLTAAGFPTAPNGTIDFNQTYNLADSVTYSSDADGNKFDKNNLFPLQNREIVIHGKTVDGEYNVTRPVAAGEITASNVAAPGSWGLLGIGLGLIGLAFALRGRKARIV